MSLEDVEARRLEGDIRAAQVYVNEFERRFGFSVRGLMKGRNWVSEAQVRH